MEKKVGFKLHKVKKNWVTIGVSTLSMVALAGGALLADQSAQADEAELFENLKNAVKIYVFALKKLDKRIKEIR